MRVLLLSAYAAGSHVHWREQLLAMLPDWQFTILELPPRHFSWRVRGNPLYWSVESRSELERGYDLVIATSMVDLATLRGLLPALASVPAVTYFHENQFAYPSSDRQSSVLEAQMVSIYSALACDQLLFNSDFNRHTFLRGVAELLKRLPDKTPSGLPELLGAKSAVLPVPIDAEPVDALEGAWPGKEGELPERSLRIVWQGRFEFDKGAEQLLAVVRELERRDHDYELALLGQTFRQMPGAFNQIKTEFAHRLVHFGFLESKSAYRALLCQADVALSTALHEFQGLAVLEAVVRGCLPLVPDRQVYPELFPSQFRYVSSLEDPEREAQAAVEKLESHRVTLGAGSHERPDVGAFQPSQLAARYRAVLSEVARSG